MSTASLAERPGGVTYLGMLFGASDPAVGWAHAMPPNRIGSKPVSPAAPVI